MGGITGLLSHDCSPLRNMAVARTSRGRFVSVKEKLRRDKFSGRESSINREEIEDVQDENDAPWKMGRRIVELGHFGRTVAIVKFKENVGKQADERKLKTEIRKEASEKKRASQERGTLNYLSANFIASQAAETGGTFNFTFYSTPLGPLEGNIPAFIPGALKKEEPITEDLLGELSSDLQRISLEDDMKNLVVGISLKDISMDSNISSFPESIEMESLKDSLKDIVHRQPGQTLNVDPEMTLILRFQRTVVMTKTVLNPQGCRLFYGALMPPERWNPELFGTCLADQLQIPDRPVRLQSSENEVKQTSRMLNALQLGISICMCEGNIYILRRCQTSVYVRADHLPNRQAVKVERDGLPVKIFDFWENFVPAFKLYQQNQGPQPSPFAVISFGQNFQTDYEEPYANLFLSLTVRHVRADQMLSKCIPESAAAEIPGSDEIDKFLAGLDIDFTLSL